MPESGPEFASPERVREFVRCRLPALCAQPRVTSAEAGGALPNASLVLLREIVRELGVSRVFEFGSGRSTQLFLECGCRVTAVEDSEDWLRQTLLMLSSEPRTRLQTVWRPLNTVFHDGSPFLGWYLNRDLRDALREADLILVDAPAYPPFREHALIMTLRRNRRGLVVLDDANIPAVARFCSRLAERNCLVTHRSMLDHGLFFAGPPAPDQWLATSRGLVETLKAWRRYLVGSRHACHPQANAVPT